MNKNILLALAVLTITACGNSNANKPMDDDQPKKVNMADSIAGDWIVTGDEATNEMSDTMGVTLKKDGSAQSINMPTYQYRKWTLKNDTIIMNAVSTAEGMPADTAVNDTGIVDFKANTITLLGGDIVYKRRQAESNNAGK